MFLISKCRRLETRLQTALLRRGLVALCGGLLVCGLWGTIPQTSRAQGTVRATVLNVPPVLASPYVSDIEQNVRQGRYGVQLTYSSATGDPVQARLRLTLRHEGEQVLQTTSQPAVFRPGTYTYRTFNELPELTFEESAGDLVDQARARLGDKIARSGVLPEGQYTIEAEPLLVDPAAPVSPLPGTAVTTVRFPQPSQLVSPTDQSTVAVEMPVFSWTPVNGTAGDVFEYELLIAEVLPGQTPLQAIEANRLVTGQGPITLRQRTSFSYTQELPPLETGATYAWQVRARETTRGVPLSDDGESEIYTFTYGNAEEQAEIADISEIPLVPDFARLTQLDRLEVQKEGEAYVLDGEATLELSFADRSEPVQATVEAQNLRVQASDPTVLLGGQIQGTAPETTPGDSLQLLAPETLRWRMDEGVTLQARVRGPDGSPVGTEKKISLTRAGPRGTLTATGNPLIRFSMSPITVRVTKLRARFPQQTLRATGQLRAFGQPVGCTIDPLRLREEAGSAVIDCAMQATFPLSPDTTAAMRVEIQDLQGTLDAQWGQDALDYDLTAEAAVEVEMANTRACGARATLRIAPGEGARLTESAPNCPVPTPRIDLGLADLMVDRLVLDELGYRPSGGWRAALTADAALSLPAFGGALLPVMTDLRLAPRGIELPQVTHDGADLSHLDPFTVDGVEMDLRGFSGPATTVPWPTGESAAASPWAFAVDLGLSFPNLSPPVPGCLQSASMQVRAAQVQNDGTFSASLLSTTLENCRLPLTPSSGALQVASLGGRVEAISGGDGSRLDPTLTLDARLETAPPLTCPDGETLSPGDDLTLDAARGLLDATAGPVQTQCELAIGPFMASMSDLTLALQPSNGQQGAFLAGTATAQVSGSQASGDFRLNLRTGRFTELDLELEGPLKLRLPRQNPALTFQIPGARLTPDGLRVEGRGQLVLPQTRIGATFDAVRIGLASQTVESGRILVDRPFGLAAQVDGATQGLTFRAVGAADAAGASAGLYFGLSGTPQVDSTGLTVRGASSPATARIDVPELTQTTGLEAAPSDSFTVGLDPFGIRQGRVTFRRAQGGSALGYADRDGLHLSPLLAAGTLPAKLPLPSKQVAYLRLKDAQGTLLVQTQQQPGGTVQLSTKPGQPLELVLPGLQGTQARPPRLDVSINQLTLDAANGTYASGTITASVPSGHRLRDLTGQGVPLALREVRFGTEQAGGVRREALFLEGGLSLLGTALKPGAARHRVTFYVESGRQAKAQVNLQGLGATVPVAGGTRAQLDVSSVTGQATVPLSPTGSPTFSLTADGAFALETGAGDRIAASDVRLTYQRSAGAGSPRLSVGTIQPQSLPSPDSIDTGPFRLAVPSINSLSLSYDRQQQALGFSAKVDAALTFDLPDDAAFTFPLRHVTLSDRGFAIPPQSVNASSVPGLSLPRFALGPAEVEPLALRTTTKTQFDWFGGGSFALSPKLDLAVFLPSFYGTSPGPPQGVTLRDVSFSGGTLQGSGTFTPQSPVQVPLGPASARPPALDISKVTAALRADAGGSGQALDIDLQASLIPGSGPLQVPNAQQCPSPTTFTLSVVEGPGLEGQVQNTDPCGRLEWGPVTLEMTQAALAFSFRQGTQRLVATGAARATLPNATANQPPITVRGQNVGVDLINGQITSGALTVGTPIRVPVPLGAQDPLLAFQVGQPGGARPVARLDKNGLTLGQVSGSVDLDPGSAGVTFNNLRFKLDESAGFPITQGTATINADVALQTGISPLDWTLVDPSTAFSKSAGVRLVLDSKATLSKDGLTFSGGGTAEARFQSRQFSSLRLGFQNGFTIGTQPVAVTGGRANLYRQQSNSPVVWFDSDGVHTSFGAVAQTAVPDTLGLPTKQVAYLVLRDPQGNLLVNTSQTSGGGTRIRTQRGQPVELVLAGLGQGGTAPSAQVGLQTTLDGGGNVSVDSLGLAFRNVGPGGLDLGANYPFALTDAFYEPKAATPFGVKATVDLPQVLQTGTTLSTTLSVGAGGFEGRVRTGEYARKHQKRLEGQPPIARVQHPSAADPTVTVKVRGIDFQFGKTPQDHTYKLSGDFQTPLLATRGAGGAKKPVLLHYSGEYAAQSWNLTGTASHIQGDLPMGVGTFDPDQLNGIVVAASDTEFSLKLNGVFAAEDLLQNFAVTVKDLKVGLKKPQGQPTQLLASAGAVGSTKAQQVSLFGGAVDLTVNDFSVGLEKNPFVLTATAGGQLSFLRPNRTVQFSGLTVGSDGSFTAGAVQMQSDLEVLGSYFKVTQLAFQQSNSQVQVDATAEATLPEPVPSTAQADITVGRAPDGTVSADVRGPDFRLDSEATEFKLGSFATLDVRGVGVDLNIGQSGRTPSLRAAASMYLENSKSKSIEFGDPARLQQEPGIAVGLEKQGGRYAPEVSYDVTGQASKDDPDDPLFEFDNGFFFRISLTSVRLSGGTNDPMQVTLGGTAGLNVEGVSGSVGYEGFTVGKNGIDDVGRIAGGGSFKVLPLDPGGDDPKSVLKMSLGAFETRRNATLPTKIRTYGGQAGQKPDDSQMTKKRPTVERYLRFSNKAGPALSLSFNAGKEAPAIAEVGEILFYQTGGATEFRLEGVGFNMMGVTNVDASIRYAKAGGQFELDVAASANLGGRLFKGQGESMGPGATLVGTIGSSSSDKLSVGLFAAAEEIGIPVLPGLLYIDDLGAGFLLRPDQDDRQSIQNAVDLSEKAIIQNKREEIRSKNKTLLTVTAYGAIGMLGPPGGYVVEGNGMVTLTSSYTMVDVKVGPGPGIPAPSIGAGGAQRSAVLGVTYSGSVQQGAASASLSLSGATYDKIGITPVLTLTTRAAFFARSTLKGSVQGGISLKSNSIDWAIYSAGTKFSDIDKPGLKVDLFGVFNLAKGAFVFSPDGIYAKAYKNVTIPNSGKFQIKGGFNLEAWAIPNQSLGGYADARVKLDPPITTITAKGKAAIIKDDGLLLYGYASVKVPFGRAHGHMAIRDGNVSAGLGKNDKYEKMIDDARSQAQSLAKKAEETAERAREMSQRAKRLRNAAQVPSYSQVKTPREDLVEAGFSLYREGNAQTWIQEMKQVERGAPFAGDRYIKMITNIMVDQRPPDSTRAHQARQDMLRKLKRLHTVAPKVEKRLRAAESKLQNIVEEHQQQSASLSSPVSATRWAPVTNGNNKVTQLPSFTVDGAQATTNRQQLRDVKSREAIGKRYRKALGAALADLRAFDRVATGQSIADYQGMARDFGLMQTRYIPSFDDGPDVPQTPPVGGSGPHAPSTPSEHQSSTRQQADDLVSYSISDVGRLYRRAVMAVQEHYARRQDYYLTRSSKAREGRRRLPTKKGARSRLGPLGSVSTEAQFKRVKSTIKGRFAIIDRLRPDVSPGSRWKQKDVNLEWGQAGLIGSRDQLKKLWTGSGMELWWKIHDLGLAAYADTAQAQAQRVADRYRKKISPLEDAHSGFTRAVDRLYALKAELAATTYGLAKEYAEWRQANGDTTSATPKQTMQNLIASLEPPKITNISAQGTGGGYYSRVRIRWSATPRSNQGRIAEVSYDLEDRTLSQVEPDDQTGSLGTSFFKTIGGGDVSFLTYHAFAPELADDRSSPPGKQTKRLSVDIRVRGEGGNTAARTATFQTSVHPASNENPSGSVMDTDNSPPTKPKAWPEFASDQQEVGTVRSGTDSYWATDSSTVRLGVRSEDPQSDITKVEYAVGSQPGQTDRQNWTQVPGVRLAGGTNRGGANWRQQVTIRGLDLSDTEPTYLSLRTTNGAGLKSKEKTMSTPFRYDSTPPSVDTASVAARLSQYRYPKRPDPNQDRRYDRATTSAVQQAPGWASPRTNAAPQNMVDPVEMSVEVPAQDRESGPPSWTFRLLDQQAVLTEAFSRAPTCPTSCWSQGSFRGERVIEWTKTGASFADTLYAYAKVTNQAGGSTIVEVPVSPDDRTRPTTPMARVRPTQQGATLYLTQMASDDESGIKGYRYAVGTSPYGTDVRDYPDAGTDFVATSPLQLQRRLAQGPFLSGSSPASSPPPSVQIPSNELPSSGRYYVSVRAVNGEGDVSEPVTSGPAAYDTTPPPKPELAATYDTSGERPAIVVTAEGLGDPESGLRKNEATWTVQPLIQSAGDPTTMRGSFHERGLGTDLFNQTHRTDIPRRNVDLIEALGYRVTLQVENGAGMTRTTRIERLIGMTDWESRSKRTWRDEVSALLQDGMSVQRLAKARKALSALGEGERKRLLNQLRTATTQSTRTDVVRRIVNRR